MTKYGVVHEPHKYLRGRILVLVVLVDGVGPRGEGECSTYVSLCHEAAVGHFRLP